MRYTLTGRQQVVSLVIGMLTLLSFGTQARADDDGNTLDNLQAAYNSESNANARYLAYAQRADEEGYGRAASLFRAAARAEQVRFEHAAMLISDLGGIPMADIKLPPIRSTRENLAAAFAVESAESTNAYPKFLAQADKDNVPEAIDFFDDARQAEAAHAALYQSALNDLPAWQAPKQDFYVCPVCGTIAEKLPVERCPVCSTPADEFITVH